MSMSLQEQPQMSMTLLKPSIFSGKMIKSAMEMPDIAEWKRDQRSRRMSIFHNIGFRTNARPSSLKTSSGYTGFSWDKEIENRRSFVRCKMEHPFLIVKKQSGYARAVYRGIAKNMNQFHILFASADLVKCFRASETAEF